MSYSTPHPPIPVPDGRPQQQQHLQQWYSPMPDIRQGQPSSYSPRNPPLQPGYFTPAQSHEYEQSPYANSFATFTPESYPAPARRRPQPYARSPAVHGQPPLESPMTFPMEIEPTYAAEELEVEVKPPPRPPNAWILYRSDRLRDIADGVTLPALDGVKAELGLSTDSGEKSPESGADGAKGESEGEHIDPKGKKRKPKKGSKAPSEGILNLGKGKTGRGIPQADISKLISMMWARESDVVKKEYDALANRKKEEVRTCTLSRIVSRIK